MLKKAILSTAIISILAGCGGGGDDTENNSGGTNPNPGGGTVYVPGIFKNAVETGDYFNKISPVTDSTDQYGALAQSCISENEYYFESDRVQVFGAQSLPDSDFKQVATWVENGLDIVVGEMGLTVEELMNQRRSLAVWAYMEGAYAISQQLVANVQYPDDFNSWGHSDKEQFGKTYIANADYDEKVSIVKAFYEVQGYDIDEVEYSYGKKIRVCLHQSDNNFQYGEGIFNGINVAAPSVNTVHNNAQVINHELVHMVQQGVSHNTGSVSISRWFAEGQAVYISGQEVATRSSHNDFDTPIFVSFFDESGYDQAEIYKHYGLAYKYIQEANSIDAIMNMIADLRNYDQLYAQLPAGYGFSGNDAAAFVMAWDKAELKSESKEVLTLQKWIEEYHQLMNSN